MSAVQVTRSVRSGNAIEFFNAEPVDDYMRDAARALLARDERIAALEAKVRAQRDHLIDLTRAYGNGLDEMVDIEDALPEGYRVDAEHRVADCLRRMWHEIMASHMRIAELEHQVYMQTNRAEVLAETNESLHSMIDEVARLREWKRTITREELERMLDEFWSGEADLRDLMARFGITVEDA